MAPLILLKSGSGPDAGLFARRARVRDRLAACWRVSQLDRELAWGTAPATRATLALRARALGEYTERTALARGLHRALRDARQAPGPLGSRTPIQHDEVLAAAVELDQLARRLVAPGPLGARGLAEVSRLLRDGSSPLYWGGAAESLRVVAIRALDGFEPRLEW